MLLPARPGVKLSIVIAAWNGPESLERCLAATERAGLASDTEVIVAANFEAVCSETLRRRFPFVRWLPISPGTTVPLLRSAGIFESAGEIVALSEDHCTFAEGWCAAVKRAHEGPYGAIGGAVENGPGQTALDWAVYFYDYGKFMLPGEEGPAALLTGMNVSYKRSVLEAVEPSFRHGLFEPFTHDAIIQQGFALYWTPSAVVYHQGHYRLGRATGQSYHHGRNYAAMRVRGKPLLKRMMFMGGSLALPLLLPARIIMQTLRNGRKLPELLRALPYLVLLTSGWSAGEFAGYVAGAGRSAGEWR